MRLLHPPVGAVYVDHCLGQRLSRSGLPVVLAGRACLVWAGPVLLLWGLHHGPRSKLLERHGCVLASADVRGDLWNHGVVAGRSLVQISCHLLWLAVYGLLHDFVRAIGQDRVAGFHRWLQCAGCHHTGLRAVIRVGACVHIGGCRAARSVSRFLWASFSQESNGPVTHRDS